DERLARARRLEERTEQDEREHHGGGHAERQAQNAFLSEVEMTDDPVEAVAAVSQDAGHQLADPWQRTSGAGHGVEQGYHRHDRDRPADGAARRLEHDQYGDDTGDDVALYVEPGAADDAVEVDEQVEADVGGGDHENAVDDPVERDALLLPEREGEEGDQQHDHQVEAALDEQVERADAGRVELEGTEAQRQ